MIIRELVNLFLELQGLDIEGYNVIRDKHKGQYKYGSASFDVLWARRMQELKKIYGYKKPNRIESASERNKRVSMPKMQYADALQKAIGVKRAKP